MIHREKGVGRAVTYGAITVKPQYQRTVVQLPFIWFARQRPVAVIVEESGKTRQVPIVDATRLVQAGLVALGLVTQIVIALLRHQGSRKRVDRWSLSLRKEEVTQ